MSKKVSSSLAAILLVTTLILSACAAQPAANSPQGAPGGNAQQSITTETKLAIGILKLEGTAQAITADQAKTLLPLWKAEKSLIANTSTSSNELQALVDQIKESMTAEQLAAIDKLDLTPQNMRTVMSDLGVQSNQAGTSSSSSKTTTNSDSGGPGGFGGPPDGGMMGGPGGGGGSSTTSGTKTPTLSASARAAATQKVSPALVNAVITLLNKKISG